MVQVFIEQVSDVQSHPNSDKLDVVTIGGKTNVANRPSPDTPRYKVGDYAVVLTENLILPDDLIKHLDMWDHTKNKGGLAGSKGNRTKARKVGGVLSEVALCSVEWIPQKVIESKYQFGAFAITVGDQYFVRHLTGGDNMSPVGQDVADLLGIAEYIPHIQNE